MWDDVRSLRTAANLLFAAAAAAFVYGAAFYVVHLPVFPLRELNVTGETAHLTHEQVQGAVTGDGRDRILAVRAELQVVTRNTRSDFGDVTGEPRSRLAVARPQLDVEAGMFRVVGIEQAPLVQLPLLIARRLPVCRIGVPGDEPQLMLPMPERGVVAVVDFDRVEQGRRAVVTQPLIELVPESAEMTVFAVAQREYAVTQLLQRQRLILNLAYEFRRAVRRVAFACRAHYEQRAFDVRQRQGIESRERGQRGRRAG